MNPYQLRITVPPKTFGVEISYRPLLAWVTGSPPRPRPDSGIFRLLAPTVHKLLICTAGRYPSRRYRWRGSLALGVVTSCEEVTGAP
jgi:hypothetical protein